jgi:hypothetical protein
MVSSICAAVSRLIQISLSRSPLQVTCPGLQPVPLLNGFAPRAPQVVMTSRGPVALGFC